MNTLAAGRAHRQTLCGPCTLDGQPAEIRAPLQSLATVQTLDPAGPSIRVPWAVVEAKARRGGNVYYSDAFTQGMAA